MTLDFFEKPGAREYEAEFESFWAIFPKRNGNPKAPARAEWMKLAKGDKIPPLPLMLAAVRAFRSHHEKERTDPKFLPHARTWLHQQRWNDWVNTRTAAPPPPPKVEADWADGREGWHGVKQYIVDRAPADWVELFHKASVEPRGDGRLYLVAASTLVANKVDAKYGGLIEHVFGIGHVLVIDRAGWAFRQQQKRGGA